MINLGEYDYELPGQLIATEPASGRSDSRLFVYDTKKDKVVFDHFYNVARYLPPSSCVIFNETKVLPSRIILRKATGGKVKALFLVNEQNTEGTVRLFADRKVELGNRLYFNENDYVTITAQSEHIFTAQYTFSKSRLYDLLKKEGTMPIPLYIKKTGLDNEQLREKYQTVFAKHEGSSAAPTASLHFTGDVLDSLNEKGMERLFLTLHVGMGTFAPLEEKQLQEKKLHNEWYEIPSETESAIRNAKKDGRPVVAVGTTVVRTLESFALTNKPTGNTDLFIYPPYIFRTVEHMITNFHLPSSSLMMLVEALLRYKGAKRHLVDLYKVAIGERFRFYSFGDAMLII